MNLSKRSKTEMDIYERPIFATPPRRLQDISFADDKSMRKLKEFSYGSDFTPRKSRETQSEDDCACLCGLPNKKYCMLTSLSGKDHHGNRKKIVWAPMSICKVL